MNRFVISKIMAITDDKFKLKEMTNIFHKRKKISKFIMIKHTKLEKITFG
jgi:hypothetical protein